MSEIILRINKNFFLDWIDCLVCITCVSKEKWEGIRDKIRSIATLTDSPVMNEILNELIENASERPADIAAYRILFGNVSYCGNVDIIAFLEDVIDEAIRDLECIDEPEDIDSDVHVLCSDDCCDDLEGREACCETICRESPTLTSTTVETLVSCEPLETY